MSSPINRPQGASPNQPHESKNTVEPSETDETSKAASKFASLMDAKPKPKTKQQKQSGSLPRGDTANKAELAADSDGSPPAVQGKSKQQGQFSDAQSASTANAEGETGDTASQGQEKNPLQSFGDSILQSLGGNPLRTEQPPLAGSTEVRASSASETIADVSRTIADRILVSDPAHSADSEVRIMLKDSVLPGTEVRITQQGGEYQLHFFTDSPESRDLLARHQALLAERLNERLDKNVVVDVKFDSKGQGEHEGGSRNRRDIMAELQAEEDGQE